MVPNLVNVIAISLSHYYDIAPLPSFYRFIALTNHNDEIVHSVTQIGSIVLSSRV